MQMPAMNHASGAVGSDTSHERSDLGDHEVVTTRLLDLRSLRFTPHETARSHQRVPLTALCTTTLQKGEGKRGL
jgi:hypothetical protein